MKSIWFSIAICCSCVLCALAHADTLQNKTIKGIFTNKGSLVAFKYEPVQAVSNPNNCDTSYLQLDSSAPFFKEQYSMLLAAMAAGKKVDISTSAACGSNLVIDWLFIHD